MDDSEINTRQRPETAAAQLTDAQARLNQMAAEIYARWNRLPKGRQMPSQPIEEEEHFE